jgi:hypothetical protein
MAWYRTGTVSVTNGSTTVTGSGTLFVANVVAGYGIVLPDGRLYEIAAVNTNTSITLATAYLGSTASGQAYAIAPLRGPEVKLAQDIAALINDYGAAFLAAGQGKFSTGTIAAPSMRNAADENTGLNLLGSDRLQLVTGGVERLLMTTSAATLNLPLEGTAVTQSATDATAGRLTKVGDFGLGGAGVTIPTGDCNELLQNGIYRIESPTTNTPAGTGPSGSLLLVQRYSASFIMQTFWQRTNLNVVRMFVRNLFGDVWGPWREIPNTGNLLGTVSQSGGVPTGALLQGNAAAASPTGGYTERTAAGFQTVHHTITSSASGDSTWTYNSAFLAGSTPIISAQPVGDADYHVRIVSRTNTACVFSIRDTSGNRVAVPVDLIARGRWSNMT